MDIVGPAAGLRVILGNVEEQFEVDAAGAIGERFVILWAAIIPFGVRRCEDLAIRECQVDAHQFTGVEAVADKQLGATVIDP